ncbi:hypothetical protein F503_05014 [Ophiostoma piceae UAMH 11346]|uniref:Uncharacterized protein n=1 Tax=Ophiostoma piceae (strain UAMH 11346) TaxID=1262450 RepID=S3C8T7_OPHP1|nr:hypothetical protein F503_05014 [Ophiostoma piceae UAMH 11346]
MQYHDLRVAQARLRASSECDHSIDNIDNIDSIDGREACAAVRGQGCKHRAHDSPWKFGLDAQYARPLIAIGYADSNHVDGWRQSRRRQSSGIK